MSVIKNIKNNLYEVFFIFLVVLLFIKSSISFVTYDEAQTFLNYVYVNNVFNFGIANNHPLNTVLILFSTNIFNNYSPIILRVPVLVFGVFYFFTAYKLTKKIDTNKLLKTLILVFNPYLFEYLTLARGYGFAASLIFLAISNELLIENKYKFGINTFILLSASYFIYPSAIVTFLYVLIFFRKYFLKNKYLNLFFAIIGIVGTLPPVYLMQQATIYDKYLYGLYSQDFSIFNFINLFGFIPLLNPDNILLSYLTFLILIIGFKRNLFKKYLKINSLILFSFTLLFLIPLILGKPLPIFRVLVPYLPLFLLFLYLNTKFERKIANILIIILIFNFLSTFEFYDTFDWEYDLDFRELVLTNYQDNNKKCFYYYFDNMAEEYYRLLYGDNTCYVDFDNINKITPDTSIIKK